MLELVHPKEGVEVSSKLDVQRSDLVEGEPEDYDRERAEAIEGIRRGLDSVARGEGAPVEQVFAELRAKYCVSDDE